MTDSSPEWVSALDGVTKAPGGLDGVGVQIGRQFAEITSISSYSFVVSCILLLILKYIPGMHLRVDSEAEMIGLDIDQFFDEQIGDWGMLEQHSAEQVQLTEGQKTGLSSGAASVRREMPDKEAAMTTSASS